MLNEHPEIFMASRELEFFNHNFNKGTGWYKEQFKGAGHAKAVGEATPGYMMIVDDPARSAERIDKSLPGVKLIALLRDPVDRLNSAFVHHIRMGRLKPEQQIMDIVKRTSVNNDPLGLVSGGLYAKSLEPYFKIFGTKLLVVLHEDVKNNPKKLYDAVLNHLGIKTGYYPKDLVKVRHSNRKDVGSKALESAKLSNSERAELYKKFFASDVAKLEKQTGLDLSSWRKNNHVS